MNNFIFSQTVRLFPPSVSYSSIILERADHLVIRTDFRESQFRPRNFPIFTRSYLRGGRGGGKNKSRNEVGAALRRLYVRRGRRPPTNGIVFYTVLLSLSTPEFGGSNKTFENGRQHATCKHEEARMTDPTSAKRLIDGSRRYS